MYKFKVTNFDLEKTLECGQCFHFTKLGVNEYIVYGFETVCRVQQKNNELSVFCSNTDIAYWKTYFTLDVDYTHIIEYLKSFATGNKDNFALNALEKGCGIRILNQPLFETCCSYILSQQNRIPRIQQMVFTLSENYSTVKQELEGVEYFCFPSVEDLKKVNQKSFEDLKYGYRSEYLYKFVQNWNNISNLFTHAYEKDKLILKTQKGIGEKVANCICLYGLNELDAFPIDTWMNKIIQEEYLNKGENLVLPNKYAGILQQHMFYTKRLK